MTTEQLFLLFIVFCPLFGAVLNGFFFRRVSINFNTFIATAAIVIPFILSCALVFGPIKEGTAVKLQLFTWISLSGTALGDFSIPFSLMADRLSGIMLLVVTGVGSLIHLYSGGYMHHEKGGYRFFAYLNLFVFAMLVLVLGSNMLTTFVGWEGVGLCSYLLIGYWYEGENNAKAGMKAFIVNRIGDFGFIIAMFIALGLYGTLEYAVLADKVILLASVYLAEHPVLITVLGLSMLLAVTGKSAQIPLYVWLPDAMAGPTPVSALIHAATMVTAGVYFMTRTSFILVQSPTVMLVIACIGAATALFAATIGFAQTDIKKVLAYSTVSQLGFMVLACGVGAFQFAIAHLVTHAFFKALLFLGSGSVIMAMHHEQDIMKMGGLFSKMKITGTTFVIGMLAIIGFPLFSGFMSKDEILANALVGPFGKPFLWGIAATAALCTAFYMTRLVILVFFGKNRSGESTYSHVKENTWLVTLPLVILAILSIFGGLISVPSGIASLFGYHGPNFITAWLTPTLEPAEKIMAMLGIHEAEPGHSLEFALMGFSTLGMFLMVGIAWKMYRNGPLNLEKVRKNLGIIYTLCADKWKIDELYALLVVKPLEGLASALFKFGDRTTIEGLVNGIPKGMQSATQILSSAQSGMVRSSLKTLFLGFVIITLIVFWGVLS